MSLPPFIGGICSATCLRNLGAEFLRADLYSAAAMHRFQQSVVLELLRLAMERAMPPLFFSLFFFYSGCGGYQYKGGRAGAHATSHGGPELMPNIRTPCIPGNFATMSGSAAEKFR